MILQAPLLRNAVWLNGKEPVLNQMMNAQLLLNAKLQFIIFVGLMVFALQECGTGLNLNQMMNAKFILIVNHLQQQKKKRQSQNKRQNQYLNALIVVGLRLILMYATKKNALLWEIVIFLLLPGLFGPLVVILIVNNLILIMKFMFKNLEKQKI